LKLVTHPKGAIVIQVIPLRIHQETSADKEAYLNAKGVKFEKVLKSSAPNRDMSKDETNKQEYFHYLIQLADSDIAEFPLTPLTESDMRASAQTFQEKAEAIFPLIEGESLIESQIGSYGNRIYVKQATNLSTVYFSDPSMVIGPEAIEPTGSSVAATGERGSPGKGGKNNCANWHGNIKDFAKALRHRYFRRIPGV
jgi:hypothetical protein